MKVTFEELSLEDAFKLLRAAEFLLGKKSRPDVSAKPARRKPPRTSKEGDDELETVR